MEGENNGTQAQQGTQQQEGNQQAAQQPQQAQQQQAANDAGGGVDVSGYEAQIAEWDARIEELEGQIAEAAKNAETADGLREEIAALKAQGADERIEFSLMLAGCRNVKAAKAVLEDHGGDVEVLKAEFKFPCQLPGFAHGLAVLDLLVKIAVSLHRFPLSSILPIDGMPDGLLLTSQELRQEVSVMGIHHLIRLGQGKAGLTRRFDFS